MLLRKTLLTDIKDLTFVELQYFFNLPDYNLNLIDQGKLYTLNLDESLYVIHPNKSHEAIYLDADINFDGLSFYELKIVSRKIPYIKLETIKMMFEDKLLVYIKNHPEIIPELKSICINKKYWILTNTKYKAIEKYSVINNIEYYRIISGNSNNVSKFEYDIDKEEWYCVMGLFKNDYRELCVFRKIILYLKIIYHFTCLNFLFKFIGHDIIWYIKILYCRDINLFQFTKNKKLIYII